MPVGQRKVGQKYLPGDVCFRVWVETKSLRGTARVMKDLGYRNPIKNTPPTPPGVETAAKRWMIDNPFVARDMLLETDDPVYAFAKDDAEYFDVILRYAHTVLSEREFRKLISNPPYAEFAAVAA